MNKNCRYLLILIITVVLQINPVFSDSTEILSKIENDIYGFEYTNDKVQNRILRLEKTIYGKGKTGDINKRIKALSNDISADMIGLEINPVRDTFLAEEDE